MNRDTYRQNSVFFSARFLPASLLGVLLQPEQRTMVGELVMITTQTGRTVDHKIVAVAWDPLYDTTPSVTSKLSDSEFALSSNAEDKWKWDCFCR
jgi:hypothetical protein